MLWSKRLDLNASVSCQAVLPALVQDGAYASAESASTKRDMGNRDHNRTRFRKIVALHPQVGARKRSAAVFFCIAQPTVKAVQTSIHHDSAFESMRHAEDSVPALHGEKTKRPHNVGTERRKWSIGNLTADTGQLNMTASL